MWDPIDKQGFMQESNAGLGQVKAHTQLADIIEKLCLDKINKSFLEIGTWNGYGSTKIFVDSLHQRNDVNTVFYSLECNKEKSNFANNLYKDYENVFILNETIITDFPTDLNTIFPELSANEQYTFYNKVDYDNMKSCTLFLNRTNIPEIFDVIFLDGGEFTTYHEFQVLKSKCKYLLLDDTNTNKCMKIVEEIYNEKNNWEVLLDKKDERNGILLCKNII